MFLSWSRTLGHNELLMNPIFQESDHSSMITLQGCTPPLASTTSAPSSTATTFAHPLPLKGFSLTPQHSPQCGRFAWFCIYWGSSFWVYPSWERSSAFVIKPCLTRTSSRFLELRSLLLVSFTKMLSITSLRG